MKQQSRKQLRQEDYETEVKKTVKVGGLRNSSQENR